MKHADQALFGRVIRVGTVLQAHSAHLGTRDAPCVLAIPILVQEVPRVTLARISGTAQIAVCAVSIQLALGMDDVRNLVLANATHRMEATTAQSPYARQSSVLQENAHLVLCSI